VLGALQRVLCPRLRRSKRYLREMKAAADHGQEPAKRRQSKGSQLQPAAKRSAGDARTKTLCVMGATGVGKGATLNSCFATDKFSTSHLFASDTVRPVSHVLPWRGTGEVRRDQPIAAASLAVRRLPVDSRWSSVCAA
jgi:hypothetical protein